MNENNFSIEIKGLTIETFNKNFYKTHPELDTMQTSSHIQILSTLQKHDNSQPTSEIDNSKQLTAPPSENIAMQGLVMLSHTEAEITSFTSNPKNP